MQYTSTKNVFLLIVVSFYASFIFAQTSLNFWKKTSNSRLITERLIRKTHPKTYQVLDLDLEGLKEALNKVSLSNNSRNPSSQIIDFPMSDGSFQQFKVTESSIMESKLAAKYSMIKTYKAVGIDDKTATMRFSITQNGLHAYSLSGKRNSEFIDPQTVSGYSYMVYNKSSLDVDTQDFKCLVDENINLESLRTDQGSSVANANDSTLRTFRLALSCNAQYGALFAGEGSENDKKANILAQMIITINRVNEIYERDLAITLKLIDRNDELIYFDIDNDPWDTEFNTKTQQVISSTLGNESLYDIGHNFNTSDGGSSGCIGCVCIDSEYPYTNTFSKGRGYTGSPEPKGDAFDIDYVAHEMGHQFGAWHTMNTCARSGNGISEVEPASGSSIMGYSGICGRNNVQSNSDAHFNYVNIRDISENIQEGGDSTCAEQTFLENTAPIAIAGQDYTIPVSTPYVLRGEAKDVDGISSLTYNWSQNDPERAPDQGAPQSVWTVGPLYRSKLPINSLNRYMPSLSDVINGDITPEWEVTPSVARTMNFAFTVRDNGSGFPSGIGQVDTDFMTVTVVDGTPFKITKPNASLSWYVGISREITWEVGETSIAPINCSKVNIKLSLDGGLTYPITLASNVNNDGSETIVVPNYESERCRVLVEAADNIFYDISNTDFSIKNSEPIFILEHTDEDQAYDVCDNTDSLELTFKYTTVSGFNELTTFSTTALPNGVTATFNIESTTEDADVILTLSNFDAALIELYNINILALSESLNQSVAVTINIKSSEINNPELLSPENGATGISESILLSWEASESALTYELDFSSTPDFSLNVSSYTIEDTTYNVTGVDALTTYYWRVRAVSVCGVSAYSEVFRFITSLCERCTSYGIDYITNLETSITRVVFNSVDNESGKTGYSDYTSIGNIIKIGEIYPISVYVNTAGNYTTKTVVWIDWNNNCDFTDAGEMYELGEATNVTNGITSNSLLEIMVPADAILGDETIMRVSTKYRINPESCETDFDGEVEDYKLTVTSTLSVEEDMFNDFKVWPNPNTGVFNVSFVSSASKNVNLIVYDVSGRLVFYKSYTSSSVFNERVNLENFASGLYVLEVNSGMSKTIQKILIE